jgi:hypothetical protein
MTTEMVRPARGLELRTLDDVERLARTAVASGLVQVRRPEEAAVILLTGRELGLSPMQSLRGIYVVSGRPVLSADLLVAVVRASGLCASWRTVESTAEVATIETLRRGEDQPSRRTWTMADAKRAGLVGKGTWTQYPAAMLRHRCAADLAREVYPDVCLGLYTPDEMGDERAPEGVRAEGPKPLPPLEVLGIEQAPAPAELPPSQREVLAMAEALSSAATVEALEALRAEYRPEYNRATAQQQDLLRAAYRARLHEVEPPTPPDGTSGPRRGPGPVASAEGSARGSSAPGGAPVASLVPEWAQTREGMRSHLADKTCRAAVERSVRLHGKRLGRAYVEAAAERVVALDAPGEEGLRLSIVGASQIVERWAHEGPRQRRAGGAR